MYYTQLDFNFSSIKSYNLRRPKKYNKISQYLSQSVGASICSISQNIDLAHDSLRIKIDNIQSNIENYSYHRGVFWGIWWTIQRTGIHAGWGETVGTRISLIFTRFESCCTNSFISDRCGAPKIQLFYEIDWLTWLRFWVLSRAETIHNHCCLTFW